MRQVLAVRSAEERVLLAFSGHGTEMLNSLSQCTGKVPHYKITPTQDANYDLLRNVGAALYNKFSIMMECSVSMLCNTVATRLM